jgi:hypothetical protein
VLTGCLDYRHQTGINLSRAQPLGANGGKVEIQPVLPRLRAMQETPYQWTRIQVTDCRQMHLYL